MHINITGHHLDLTQAIKDYCHEKFEKLERHASDIESAHLILTVEKSEQRAEARLHFLGRDVFADTKSADLYAAIDDLIDKLDRQLLKQKEKVKQKRA